MAVKVKRKGTIRGIEYARARLVVIVINPEDLVSDKCSIMSQAHVF